MTAQKHLHEIEILRGAKNFLTLLFYTKIVKFWN